MTIELIGKKFGKLTVVEQHQVRDKNGHILWKCLCDCGKTKSVRGDALRRGKTRSCGCSDRPRGNKSSNFQGVGDLPKKYFSIIKNKAKLRNIDFDLTIEYLWNLFLSQNKKCSLSGIEISFATSEADRFENKSIKTASLDRIDSSKGYIEGNVQWVHKDVNFMKQSFEQEYFLKLCSQIVSFRGKTT